MTRSPGLMVVTPSPTALTIPASSLPGEKGSGGLSWYLFSMIRTSGKLTLAALSLTTASPGPGTGDSTSSNTSDCGGPYALQRIAFMISLGRRLSRRHRDALPRDIARSVAAQERGERGDVLRRRHALQRRALDERPAHALHVDAADVGLS